MDRDEVFCNCFRVTAGDIMDAIEEGECYSYTISSLGAKGEELFMKELEDVTIIMAYPDDSRWDDTTFYILDNKKRFEYDENYWYND